MPEYLWHKDIRGMLRETDTERRDPGMAGQHGHDHGHGHGHGGGSRKWWARLRHVITPHSHDSVDRVDPALETSARGLRTLLWSFLTLALTAVAQLVVVLLSGSVTVVRRPSES